MTNQSKEKESLIRKQDNLIPSGDHTHWSFQSRPESAPFTSKDGVHQHIFLVSGKLLKTEYDGEHRHPVDMEARTVGAQTEGHSHEIMINGNYVETMDGGAHAHPASMVTVDNEGDLYVNYSGDHRHTVEIDGQEYTSITADDVLSVETRKNLEFEVQSILFNKDRFRDFEKAADWADKNNFTTRDFEERQQAFVFNQIPRDSFSQTSLQTVRLAEGVEAVIGVVVESQSIQSPRREVATSEGSQRVSSEEEMSTFDQLQAALTNGYDILNEEQSTQMSNLKDEFAVQVLALRTAVETVFPTVMNFVEDLLEKSQVESEVAALDRVATNMAVLDDTLEKMKLPDVGVVKIDESLDTEDIETAVIIVSDSLIPVAETFADTSFENLSLLLKSVGMSLSRFKEDFLTLKNITPSPDMSRDELKEIHKQRSERFGIEIVEGSSLRIPDAMPEDLSDYGDPVNLKFPIDTEERAKNAQLRFEQFSDQIYNEDISKARVLERIVKRKLELGLSVKLDPNNENINKLLPTTIQSHKDVTLEVGNNVEKKWFIPIIKSSQEERTAFGVVLEPDVTDLHGDTYDEDTVVKAAHNFMENFQNIGLMHDMFINEEVNILESFVAPTDMVISSSSGPVTIRKNTWLMKVRILADELWNQVKLGDLTGFSIGALANVEELTPRTRA